MCDTCGCNITPGNSERAHHHRPDGNHTAVEVLSDLLQANNHEAAHNRSHFDENGVLAVNLMSSPGAGKTALLEATIDALAGDYRIAVIEGDLETENDAVRIRAKGVPAVQISTGTACHLDAHMVHEALHHLDLPALDLVFIENVGNLVCPASFDLGQHANATLLSVTEGDDKPAKYPVMFRASDVVLLTKTDLLDVFDDFRPENVDANLGALGCRAPLLRVAARKRPQLDPWLDWLRARMRNRAGASGVAAACAPAPAAGHAG